MYRSYRPTYHIVYTYYVYYIYYVHTILHMLCTYNIIYTMYIQYYICYVHTILYIVCTYNTIYTMCIQYYILYVLYSMVSVQQTHLVPENTSQKDVIFALSLYHIRIIGRPRSTHIPVVAQSSYCTYECTCIEAINQPAVLHRMHCVVSA